MKKEVKTAVIRVGSIFGSEVKPELIEKDLSPYAANGWSPVYFLDVSKRVLFFFRRKAWLVVFTREVA